MYKIIIADDEKIVRQGLNDMIDWKALNFEVEGLFSDGQEVIEYLEYAMQSMKPQTATTGRSLQDSISRNFKKAVRKENVSKQGSLL